MPPLRRSDLARPFLKWAGGKTQLLPRFQALYPPAGRARRYIEPFVGSAAVFFQVRRLLRPEEIILADGNEELVNVYREIQGSVGKVIRLLSEHRRLHSKEHYYRIRSLRPGDLSPAGRAARFIYLNKTCFNGLYRVNSRGGFNVPMGSYRDPPILDAENLRNVARSLEGVELKVARFHETLGHARAGDFIYFDPPYQPVSETSRFTSYTRDSFGPSDQEELAEVFAALSRRGCMVMLSNSDCAFIRGLYRDFAIHAVPARRSINSKGDRRGPVSEVVVLNYEAPSPERAERRLLQPQLLPRNVAVSRGSAGGVARGGRAMRRGSSPADTT
jgi:DNA adenine methylase